MRPWQTIVWFLFVVCIMTATRAMAAPSEPAPRSDGRVWNIDFEGYIDGGAGFLNAGVRRLGNGGPEGNQAYAMVPVSKDLAFAGDRFAHIVAKVPNRRAQISLQRRFDVPEVDNEVIEFAFRPTAHRWPRTTYDKC